MIELPESPALGAHLMGVALGDLPDMAADLWAVFPNWLRYGVGFVVFLWVLRFLVLNFRPVKLDSQRLYDKKQRALGRKRAGNQCEHKHPLWFRCKESAEQADHIYPWSKGGATSMMNLQYLCQPHNGRKSANVPGRLYIWRLERRRKDYFPEDQDRKVSWRLADKPFQYDFNPDDPGRRMTLRQELRRGNSPLGRSSRSQRAPAGSGDIGSVPASFYVRANRDHPETDHNENLEF